MFKIKSIVCVMLFLMAGTAYAGYWSFKTIDAAGEVGWYTSIALDVNGNPHISYFDNDNDDLKYAKKIGASWSIETVDTTGDCGHYTSISLDADGNPHISYFDDTNDNLKYAKKTGATWSIENVDTTGVVGLYTSIAVDANGNPHISYYNNSGGDLRCAKKTGATWNIESVDTAGNVGRYTSIALDANGNTHISYFDNTNLDLRYAQKVGNYWYKDTVDASGNVGWYTSITVDANGNPHISYTFNTNVDLRYAKKIGTTWSIETVEVTGNVGWHTSIALDANGNPYISYYEYGGSDLKYAKKIGGSWSTEIVDANGAVGSYTSLALDANGNPHISYLDGSNYDLRYTTTAVRVVYPNGGEVWSPGEFQTILWDGEGEIDIYFSPDGGNSYSKIVDNVFGGVYTIVVPNTLTNAGLIKIVRQDTLYSEDVSDNYFTIQHSIPERKFRKVTVDAASLVGAYNSIALDAYGNPHISYSDLSYWDLKYATKTGATWSIERVDTAGFVSYYTSIALDAGNPHISYQDYMNADLRYAKKIGASWYRETVDTTGNVGLHTSICLDANGNPHISYFDNTNGDVKYAKKIGSWSIERVDTTGNVGKHTSLVLDASGNPHISYTDNANYDLRYAKKIGAFWSLETIDTTGLVGSFTSLALDANGNPHIAYFDDTNDDLKYAKKIGTTWSIETVDATGNVGSYASLILDANGNPHISYSDYTNFDLKYAKKTGGTTWSIETVDAAGNVGDHTSIALDVNGNPHISYYNNSASRLKYTTTALNILDPIGGETWDVGAIETIRWAGPRDIDAYISLQGGDDWTPLLFSSTGTSEGDTWRYSLQIPHFPTRFAKLKLAYPGLDPNEASNYSISDSFFTIQSTITALSFTANPGEEGGVELAWETEPGLPDINGYNLYWSHSADGEFEKINSSLITENKYIDNTVRGALVIYRLGAVNGLNTEYIVGELDFAGFDEPLVVYPSLLRNKGTLFFWFPKAFPGENETDVTISVYNILGEKVKVIVDKKLVPGFHTCHFDGKDDKGVPLPCGTYFVIMQTPKYTERVKFVKY